MSQINKSRINFKPNKINYMQLNVFELFPTPVLKFNIGRNFTKEEVDYIVKKEAEVAQPPFLLFIGNNTTVNKKILEHPEMIHLKAIVESCLKEWCDKVYNPMYGDKFRLKITQSWLNYTKPGEQHKLHYHPNSIVSGVIYISANIENDMISFLSDRKMTSFIEPLGLNKFNSVTVNIHVNQGDIILFPSDLSHSVPVNNENYTRVSLAFNSYFEGILGDSDDDPNYIEIKLAQ